MPIRHRRETKTLKAPSLDQIDIGEIVVNTKTGKLYIVSAAYNEETNAVEKQSVIEFSGKVVCQTQTVPDIEFDDVSDFCCFGDTLSVSVSGLDRITDYDFVMQELTANGSTVTVESPHYTNYTGSDNSSLLRSAIIPVNINVNKDVSAVSVFKFGIEVENDILTEKVLSIRCKDCSPPPAPPSV
jgi:hypothetical protein